MPHTTPSSGATRPAILVVDDHPANQIAFDAVLAPGHSIMSASSGAEALGRYTPEAAAAHTEFRLHAEGGAVAKLDRVRMEQLLSNLLSNAIRYGEGTPVAMRLDVHGGVAHIRGRDGGAGLAPESRARIFERLERAATARRHGGFGLGLWGVRQIVEASGGHVAVDSHIGRGSTFTIELPLRSGVT